MTTISEAPRGATNTLVPSHVESQQAATDQTDGQPPDLKIWRAVALGAAVLAGSAAVFLGPAAIAAMRTAQSAGNPMARLDDLAGLADAHLAAHFIRRADVPKFLDGSAWQHTTFHDCSTNTAQSIITNGAVVDRNKRSVHGQAMYTSMSAGSWKGHGHTVELAIKTENPYIGRQFPPTINGYVEDLERIHGPRHDGESDARFTRRMLLAAGHDSVILRTNEEADWVLGLDSSKIRVVVDTSTPRPPAPTRLPAAYAETPIPTPTPTRT